MRQTTPKTRKPEPCSRRIVISINESSEIIFPDTEKGNKAALKFIKGIRKVIEGFSSCQMVNTWSWRRRAKDGLQEANLPDPVFPFPLPPGYNKEMPKVQVSMQVVDNPDDNEYI